MRSRKRARYAGVCAVTAVLAVHAGSASAYNPIIPSKAGQTSCSTAST